MPRAGPAPAAAVSPAAGATGQLHGANTRPGLAPPGEEEAQQEPQMEPGHSPARLLVDHAPLATSSEGERVYLLFIVGGKVFINWNKGVLFLECWNLFFTNQVMEETF
jgi:hypothetical protein